MQLISPYTSTYSRTLPKTIHPHKQTPHFNGRENIITDLIQDAGYNTADEGRKYFPMWEANSKGHAVPTNQPANTVGVQTPKGPRWRKRTDSFSTAGSSMSPPPPPELRPRSPKMTDTSPPPKLSYQTQSHPLQAEQDSGFSYIRPKTPTDPQEIQVRHGKPRYKTLLPDGTILDLGHRARNGVLEIANAPSGKISPQELKRKLDYSGQPSSLAGEINESLRRTTPPTSLRVRKTPSGNFILQR